MLDAKRVRFKANILLLSCSKIWDVVMTFSLPSCDVIDPFTSDVYTCSMQRMCVKLTNARKICMSENLSSQTPH